MWTCNSYLVAVKAFCHWMVRDGRATVCPVEHLRQLNTAPHQRRKRRALTADELRKLILAAGQGEPIKGMPGRDRAMLYRLAAETGLRWSELQSLRRDSFALDAEPPRVTVEAGDTKNIG